MNTNEKMMLHDAGSMLKVSLAFSALEKAITEARGQVYTEEARQCLRELDEILVDVRHDCSLNYVVQLTAAGGDL